MGNARLGLSLRNGGGKRGQHGSTPRNNKAQNEQVASLVKKYQLTKEQRQRLHVEVTKQGYSYHEVEQIIKDMFGK